MKPRKKQHRLGMAGYARICAALRDKPRSLYELTRDGVVARVSAYRVVCQLFACGWLHVVEMRASAPRHAKQPVFAFGRGESIPGRVPKGQGSSEVIAFASLLTALEDTGSIDEIEQETGINKCTVRKLVKQMAALGLAHICRWNVRAGGGPAIRVFSIGRAKQAKRPKPKGRQAINRDYWERRKRAAPFNAIASHFAANQSQMTVAE
jgi:hypothetical protein